MTIIYQIANSNDYFNLTTLHQEDMFKEMSNTTNGNFQQM